MNNYKVGQKVQYLNNGREYEVVHTRRMYTYNEQGIDQILVLEDAKGHMVSCLASCVKPLTHLKDSINTESDIIEVEWEIVD